jgi:glycerol-3-phosphate acyltransferase PlsX
MSNNPLRIGIDLMGSDCFPAEIFKAIEHAVKNYPKVEFIAFVTQEARDEIHARYPLPSSSLLKFKVFSEVIQMDDDPLLAIRQKKKSTLVSGLKLLKRQELDAFVSAGNTGALIAGAMLSLPLLPLIKRAGLLAILPTEKGNVAVLDVGGNVSCKASHLLQFALMGAAYPMQQGD